MNVRAGEQRKRLAVGAPAVGTELTGHIDDAHCRAVLGADHVDFLLHVVVVDERRGRDAHGQVVARGVPLNSAGVAGKFEACGFGRLFGPGVRRTRRGDPDAGRSQLFFVGFLIEAFLREFLFLLGLLVERSEGELLAVGRPGVVGDVGVVREDFAGFATGERDQVQRASFVAVALGEKRNSAAIGRPGDRRDVVLAGDVGAALALPIDDVQLRAAGPLSSTNGRRGTEST